METDFFDDPSQLAPPRALREDRPDGSFVLRSPEPLQPYAHSIGDWLDTWAERTPDALALAERDADGAWQRMDYATLRRQVGAVAQALLALDAPAQAPVVILSDNSIHHAVLMLAAQYIGRPACTVSSAYSRLSKTPAKVHAILQRLKPALVHASDAGVYGAAAEGAGAGVPQVYSRQADRIPGARSFDELLAAAETPAVAAAHARVQPDDVAKYLLTSGSTGEPKVVINTHRMLCANQQMMKQTWRFLQAEPPVVLDWLPWSHTFGGNHNLHMVLANGGSLYIDEGRPAPGLIERTVANLREVQPTLYFNVPRGFDMLLPALEADDALARHFFEKLKLVFYAGAALPQSTWERLEAVAARVRGAPVWFTTSWGSTETSPAITSAHWKLDRAGVIGLPLPGLSLKFVPVDGKLELRVHGVTIFPGYRDAPALTAQAFDEEGYYRIGDAGRLLDDAAPERGVVFDGRVAEDFKLTTGTMVSVGTVRVKLIAMLSPWVQDAVLTGHDRAELGALLFPSPAARELPPTELADRLSRALDAWHAGGEGSSRVPARVLVLDAPPDADAGEITDKGYLNQRTVLRLRDAEVQRLYASAGPVVVNRAS